MVSFSIFLTCVVNFSFRRCIYRCSKLWKRPKIWIQICIFLPSKTEGTKLNFPQCCKITKMSHFNFHAENDDNFWCDSQVQKMLASLAMRQNETFLSDFDILWLRFVTMAKLGHFEANIPISFVLVVHLLPRFPLPRYKSWLEWRIKKREQSKHCIHSSIRSKINFQTECANCQI